MQSDLFGSVDSLFARQNSAKKSDFLEKFRVSFRLDQVLILAIVGVILYVIVFSFGVEKGKQFAWSEIQAERHKREEMIREFRGQLMARPLSVTQSNPTVHAAAQRQTTSAEPTVAAVEVVESVPAGVKSSEPARLKGDYTIQSVTYKTKTDAQ
ncbi:hypothetical protein N9K06_01570, partial [Omnitrophica bacterium]|nr:hypothetical protein [Candidatus Omnitrophota bacterium]